MIGMSGHLDFSEVTIRLTGSTAYRSKAVPVSEPAQLSKSLTTSAPASICAVRYEIVGLSQKVNQGIKSHGIGVPQFVGRSLVRCSASCDHIGRYGPRSASESDERGLGWQLCGQNSEGLVDRCQSQVDIIHGP